MEHVDGLRNAIDALIEKVGDEAIVEYDGDHWPLFALSDFIDEMESVVPEDENEEQAEENIPEEIEETQEITDDECDFPLTVDQDGVHTVAFDDIPSETIITVLTE